MVHITLVPMLTLWCFDITTFRNMCAVPNMAVSCSSFISCFPGMLLRYFLNDSETVPVASIITGIAFVFTFYMRCISIVGSLYFRIFLVYFCLLKFQHLLAYMFLFHCHGLWCLVYCWGWFCRFALVDSTIWLPSLFDLFLLILAHAHNSVFFIQFYIFMPMLKCSWAHTLSCPLMYCSFASTGHADIMFIIIIIIIIIIIKWISW